MTVAEMLVENGQDVLMASVRRDAWKAEEGFAVGLLYQRSRSRSLDGQAFTM